MLDRNILARPDPMLTPLLIDPEPTDAELAELIPDIQVKAGFEHIAPRMARLQWRENRLRADDSAFHVAFSTHVQQAIWDALGVADYAAYQKTELWKAIRKRVLERAGRICIGCDQNATQVHHRDYRASVLRGEDDTPLVAICKPCHEQIHRAKPGREGHFDAIEEVLAELANRKPPKCII